MKRLLTFAIAVIAALGCMASTKVYLLRLDDEIGSATWRNTRQGLDDAREKGADMLLVHLNTYGGSVVHADSIRTALLNCQLPVVAFVDNNAASAGALIALACDTVYMRSGSSMGAATVVNGTDGAAMPDKYQSYMRAMMRSTAESHGRDSLGRWRRNPSIAEAMVDPRVTVKGLIDSTKVLTFTADEAVRWHYADGRAESVDEVLRNLGVDSYSIDEYHPDWLDHLIGFFTNPAVQAVLIMIIIGGIYMELHTPGLAFPAAASIIAAVLYFLPIYVTGIASSWIIIVFVIGVVLLVLEIFVVPGFGLTGISGLACMGLAIVLALIEHYSFTLDAPDMSGAAKAGGIFLAGLLMAVGLILYLTSSHGPKWFVRRTALETSQLVADGYIGVDMSPAKYVGSHAVTLTDLRPSGKIAIDNKEYDAVSVRDFIPENTRVVIERYENAQLYVRSAEKHKLR